MFDFNEAFTDLDTVQVNRWIKSNINANRGKQYMSVILVWKQRAVEVTRDEILDNELLPALKKLKAEE